jgi:PPOX class probable F420-dependent enzyme
MSMRDLVRMSDDEVAGYLAGQVRARMSTLNKDGSPHVVPMSYVLVDGKVTFWADNDSQKMKNLQRDARIAVIVDDGMDFQELRGVQLAGTAELTTDAAVSERIADAFCLMAPEEHREAAKAMLLGLAAERTAVIVHPAKVASWDHRKLGGGATAQDLGH